MAVYKRIPVLETFSWQPPVLEINDTPTSSNKGDRFLVSETPSGYFAGEANKIAWIDASNWHFDTPSAGWKVYVEDEDDYYIFNGSEWISESEYLADTFMERNDSGSVEEGNIPTWEDNEGNKLSSGYGVATSATEGDLEEKIFRADTIKDYVDALLGEADAMVYKGVIDAHENPNYPAADAGHTYKISVAGKVGGADGEQVEVGDMLICINDDTPAGTQAEVGSHWNIIQTNIEGYVLGPETSTVDKIAVWNNVTGNALKDSDVSIADVRTHLDDGSIHYESGSIEHQDLTGAGTYDHSQIDTHITTYDIHRTMNYIEEFGAIVYDETETLPE